MMQYPRIGNEPTPEQRALAENPFSLTRKPLWTLVLLREGVISLESVQLPLEAQMNAEMAELRKRFPRGDFNGPFSRLLGMAR